MDEPVERSGPGVRRPWNERNDGQAVSVIVLTVSLVLAVIAVVDRAWILAAGSGFVALSCALRLLQLRRHAR